MNSVAVSQNVRHVGVSSLQWVVVVDRGGGGGGREGRRGERERGLRPEKSHRLSRERTEVLPTD